MDTELGQIAALIRDVEELSTPLQRPPEQRRQACWPGRRGRGRLVVIGLLLLRDLRDMFLTAVSVAVAVVPGGLPAVVTVTLALARNECCATPSFASCRPSKRSAR